MRKFAFTFLVVFIALWADAQAVLKTAEDTAIALGYLRFPQMQASVVVPLVASDFSLVEQRKWRESDVDSLAKLIAKDPQNGDHYKALSDVYSYLLNEEMADSLLTKAADLFMDQMMINPADTHAVASLANIYFIEGKWSLVAAYYQELINLAPESSKGWRGLGTVKAFVGDLNGAIPDMEKAINLEPALFENYCELSNVLMMKSFVDASAADSAQLEKMTYRDIMNLGFLEEANRRNPQDSSIQALMNAMKLMGLVAITMMQNSDVYYSGADTMKLRIKPEVRKELDAMKEIMVAYANGSFRTKVFPYSCLMILGLINNDLEDARHWFEISMKYNPKNNVLYENMVGVYVFYQKKPPAIEIQKRLVDLYPNTRTMLILGYLYFRSDSLDSARYWVEKALKLDPFNPDLLLAMSAVAGSQLRLGEALDYTDKILKNDSQNIQAQLHMAIFGLFTQSIYSTKALLRKLSEEPYQMVEAEEMLQKFFPD